jgi:hypothetical protein
LKKETPFHKGVKIEVPSPPVIGAVFPSVGVVTSGGGSMLLPPLFRFPIMVDKRI